jgi:hypothetical protein
MAKSFKGKEQKVKEIKFDTMESVEKDWTLEYGKASKRYDLKREGSTVLSHVSVTACKNKAKTQGVVWN